MSLSSRFENLAAGGRVNPFWACLPRSDRLGYRLAAALVLLAHLAFIVFVIAGALLGWRQRWVLALHFPAAAWGAWVEASGAGCPLTAAENYLRVRGGLAGYDEGFLEHYLQELIYPAGLNRQAQYGLAAAVLLVNALLYTVVLGRRRTSGRVPRSPYTGRVEVPPPEEP
jgi:Protein of Unknown function (DUF2784)